MLESYTDEELFKLEVVRRLETLKEGNRLTFVFTNHPELTALEIEGFMDPILPNLHPDYEHVKPGELTGIYIRPKSYLRYFSKRLIKRNLYLKRKSFFKMILSQFKQIEKYKYEMQVTLLEAKQ